MASRRDSIDILNDLFRRLRTVETQRDYCDVKLARLIWIVEELLKDPRMPDAIWNAAFDAVVELKVFNNHILSGRDFLRWSGPDLHMN